MPARVSQSCTGKHAQGRDGGRDANSGTIDQEHIAREGIVREDRKG